ncbi:MAG: hypothetical protein WCK92_08115 [Bacteroidota bacterium]
MNHYFKSTCLIFFILISTFVYGQKYNSITEIPLQKKGKLVLQDGTTIKFRSLRVDNDSVRFENKSGQQINISNHSVYRIIKTGNYAGILAISFGVGGLIGSLLGTINWKEPPLNDMRTTWVICWTSGLTLIGASIGLAIKKESTIYRSPLQFTVFPKLNTDLNGFHQPELAIVITI